MAKKRASTVKVKTASGPEAADNAPVVRREIFNMETLNILLSGIILVVLLYSMTGAGNNTASKYVSDENSCRTFCEYNPQYGEAKFGGISGDGHCLCEIQLDSIPNTAKNKSLSVTILIDQGIIVKDAELQDGIVQLFTAPIVR